MLDIALPANQLVLNVSVCQLEVLRPVHGLSNRNYFAAAAFVALKKCDGCDACKVCFKLLVVPANPRRAAADVRHPAIHRKHPREASTAILLIKGRLLWVLLRVERFMSVRRAPQRSRRRRGFSPSSRFLLDIHLFLLSASCINHELVVEQLKLKVFCLHNVFPIGCFK